MQADRSPTISRIESTRPLREMHLFTEQPCTFASALLIFGRFPGCCFTVSGRSLVSISFWISLAGGHAREHHDPSYDIAEYPVSIASLLKPSLHAFVSDAFEFSQFSVLDDRPGNQAAARHPEGRPEHIPADSGKQSQYRMFIGYILHSYSPYGILQIEGNIDETDLFKIAHDFFPQVQQPLHLAGAQFQSVLFH